MGTIDIAEKRRPQDGRIKMNLHGKHYDLRVSFLPTNHGQSCVMRILDRGNIQVSIKDLGFGEDDFGRFQQIIKRPNGIFLVTGPTGSGKTTTLYAALNELNRPDRKIITAEDPVEYYLPGINQVEVKHNIGLDFARIIRAMLRQAPNIILVGEIRDQETAEIAIQASLTGHLVFSTLHTNDAPSAITRLIDIGVQPFLVASSVIAIMAQRLVRMVCPKCKEPDDAVRRRNQGGRPDAGAGQERHVHARPRLHPLQPHRLPRPQGHLRDAAHDRRHARDDVQARTDPEHPPPGPPSGHEDAAGRRSAQSTYGHDHAGRSAQHLPS